MCFSPNCTIEDFQFFFECFFLPAPYSCTEKWKMYKKQKFTRFMHDRKYFFLYIVAFQLILARITKFGEILFGIVKMAVICSPACLQTRLIGFVRNFDFESPNSNKWLDWEYWLFFTHNNYFSIISLGKSSLIFKICETNPIFVQCSFFIPTDSFD